MQAKLIIALDNLYPEQALQIMKNILSENTEYQNRIIFKIHDIVSLIGFTGIQKLFEWVDCKFMLDPKWHDIPNTLKNYIIQLKNSGLGDKVEYITVHTSGGADMLKLVQTTKDEYLPHIKLLGITAMTSLDDDDTGYVFDNTARHSVLRLAKLALDSGIQWLVCSAYEGLVLREVYGSDFDIVTPGVRFAGGDTGDQKRVMTPAEAIRHGATNIVMGRPILETEDVSQSITRFFSEVKDVEYIPEQKYHFEKMLYTGDWKEILSYIGAFYFCPEWGKYCRLASGLLSNAYINIGTTERNYLVVEKAAWELAQKIRSQNIEADVVMGAQMWSVRSSLYLAEKLGIEQSVYTEKSWDDNEQMKLKRHDIELRGQRVIISEDIVTKWSTLRKMKSMIEEAGGQVVAIACVWNRHGNNIFDGVPLISCYVPEQFDLYWDENTPEDQRKNFPQIPDRAEIAEKPKNEWGELVESMRK